MLSSSKQRRLGVSYLQVQVRGRAAKYGPERERRSNQALGLPGHEIHENEDAVELQKKCSPVWLGR